MEPELLYEEPKKQPVLNVPSIVLILIAIFAAVHLLREYGLTRDGELNFLYSFSFIPGRFSSALLGGASDLAKWWTPISYSFLHGDWTHLLMNSIWILAFGSVVARRFGISIFLIFSVVCSIAGAIAHYLSASDSLVPMIGASAIVSGCMGASVRFAFPRHGRFNPQTHNLPAQSMTAALRNPQAVVFVIVWFAINLLFGLGGELIAGEGQSIAWQAHIGGFLVGLLAFSLFDRQHR